MAVVKKAAPKKAAVKKVDKKDERDFIVEKVCYVVDARKIPSGTYAIYGGVSGIIYNEGKVNSLYFCSNSSSLNGGESPYKFGKRYSWAFSYDSKTGKLDADLEFPHPPAGWKKPYIPEILSSIAGYTPVVLKGYVQFGCQNVKNETIRNLVKHLKD